MKHCKTCKYQDKSNPNSDRDSGGICTNPHITEDWLSTSDPETIDMLIYSYQEGGSFWVGDNFGCVHHEEVIEDET